MLYLVWVMLILVGGKLEFFVLVGGGGDDRVIWGGGMWKLVWKMEDREIRVRIVRMYGGLVWIVYSYGGFR